MENSLAMEMLQELKRSSKRKDVIIVILIIAFLLSNVAWLMYESQFEEQTIQEQTIENEEGLNNANINQEIGE